MRLNDMTESQLSERIAALETERARLDGEATEIASRNGDDASTWPTGQTERMDNVLRSIDRVDDDLRIYGVRHAELRSVRLADLNAARERVRVAAQDPANRTPAVNHGRVRAFGDDVRDRAARAIDENHRAERISDGVAERISSLVGQPGQRGVDMAKWADVAGNPDYLAAFSRRMADPIAGHLGWTGDEGNAYREADEYARTALSLSGGAAMLPLALDPTVALTNAGSTTGIRNICRQETIASNAWNGVTSAGATTEWKVENAQAADGTPAVATKNIPVYLLDVDAVVSYELAQDGLNFTTEIGKVLQDAAAVAVDAALATGSGSGAPTGITTALTGSSEILTAGAFAYNHITAVQNAVPARFQHSASWVASLPVINTVSQFVTAGNAFYYPEVKEGTLLRRQLVEDSNVSTDMTTSGSRFLVYGDWNQYLMVTRTGASIQILPNYGANGRPTASWNYFLTMRVGADALVTSAFRYLRKS